MRALLVWVVAPFMLILSLNASAASGRINSTYVTALLVDDTDYGGCMMELSRGPQTVLGGCGGDWVSLDCLAAFPESTKSNASQKYAQAQLAFISGNRLRVYITDDRTVNGFCFATRVDVLPP